MEKKESLNDKYTVQIEKSPIFNLNLDCILFLFLCNLIDIIFIQLFYKKKYWNSMKHFK